MPTCVSVGGPRHVSVVGDVPTIGGAGQSIVLAGGTAVNVGGVLSRTVIVWLTVAAESFPHASVAFQVSSEVRLVGQLPSTRTSAPSCVTVAVPLHVPLAVGVRNTGGAGQM